MYTNNAYLNNSTIDRKDKSKPLVITMCGTYKLYTRPKLPTWRPRGRLDFQLLYIAAGKAHFHFDNNDEETIVHAGHMVLYRPKEPQKYEYYAKDQTGKRQEIFLRKPGDNDLCGADPGCHPWRTSQDGAPLHGGKERPGSGQWAIPKLAGGQGLPLWGTAPTFRRMAVQQTKD